MPCERAEDEPGRGGGEVRVPPFPPFSPIGAVWRYPSFLTFSLLGGARGHPSFPTFSPLGGAWGYPSFLTISPLGGAQGFPSFPTFSPLGGVSSQPFGLRPNPPSPGAGEVVSNFPMLKGHPCRFVNGCPGSPRRMSIDKAPAPLV